MDDKVSSPSDFRWLYHLRYTYNPKAEKISEKLWVSLSNAKFSYGFEYLGIGERLVQTPLTDKCYLTLTQALHFRMGGSPFGPAGTGMFATVFEPNTVYFALLLTSFCNILSCQAKPKL